jgi:hypothetical protein
MKKVQFRECPETSERRRKTTTGPIAGQRRDHKYSPRSMTYTANNTQIYEGADLLQ